MDNRPDTKRGPFGQSRLSSNNSTDYEILLNIFSFLEVESGSAGQDILDDWVPSIPIQPLPRRVQTSRTALDQPQPPQIHSWRTASPVLTPVFSQAPPQPLPASPSPVMVPASPSPVMVPPPGFVSRSPSGHLYRASLVCKAFFRPAMDILWRSMDSLIPILELLPTMKKIDGVYMLTGEVKAEHVHRFETYGSRIQTFTLTEFNQPQIAPFTLLHIASLLPKIPHVLCSSAHALSLSTAPLLLTNGLKRLELRNVTGTAVNVIKPFLCTLQARVPQLEHLMLRDSLGSDTLSVIPSFQYLLSLEFIGIIDIGLFSQIVTLPELRKLILNVTDSMPVETPRTANIIGLRKLKALHITGFGVTVESFILRLEGSSLIDVCITMQPRLSHTLPLPNEFDRENPDLSFGNCLFAISSRWPALRSLCAIIDSRSSQVVSQMALNAMQKFADLKKLHLGPPLRPPELLDLAAKLSNLLTLQVEIRDTSPLDLGFLSSMMKMYPSLSTLNLRFCHCEIPVDLPTPVSISPHLKTLIINANDTFRAQDLQKALRIGEYLDKIFPELQSIEIDTCSGAAFWKHIRELVITIQRARRGVERDMIQQMSSKKRDNQTFVNRFEEGPSMMVEGEFYERPAEVFTERSFRK
ncbi:hypothetical protein E4T56_gene16220 [Termitomyces sp. T112]|nr:hypothetical protein E4T56_gene16220 [Termitomyces sp. T112]